jgi:hypothetical protein
VLALAALAGCTSSEAGSDATDRDATTTTTRPPGPSAVIEGPLTAGKGIDLVSARTVDLDAAGWVEEELTAEGTATSYRASGDLPADGTFEVEPDAEADYRTRIVVRRPRDERAFNGTVVVEWLNVSAGFDSPPDFGYLADELLRGGYAWVGVTAQLVGVDGGEGLVRVAVPGAPTGGLRDRDPDRYGALQHPGDAFSYDIYTQVARALRDPGRRTRRRAADRVRRVAVGVPAHDVRERRPTAHPSVRRVPHPQPRPSRRIAR